MVLLWTADPTGTCFVRTDQLDGETDWKMKIAVAETQGLGGEGGKGVANIGSEDGGVQAEIYADAPMKDIHTFIGTFTLTRPSPNSAPTTTTTPLTVENLLWANTVLASSFPVLGFVIYTGPETRAVMNTSKPESKVCLLFLYCFKSATFLAIPTLVSLTFNCQLMDNCSFLLRPFSFLPPPSRFVTHPSSINSHNGLYLDAHKLRLASSKKKSTTSPKSFAV